MSTENLQRSIPKHFTPRSIADLKSNMSAQQSLSRLKPINLTAY